MAVKRQNRLEKREEEERRAAQERAAQAQRSQAEWEAKGLRPAGEQKTRVMPLVVRLDKQNDESAAQVASRIPDETARGEFIDDYRKISGAVTPRAMLLDEAEARIPKARETTTASLPTVSPVAEEAEADEGQGFWEGVKESAGAFWEGLTGKKDEGEDTVSEVEGEIEETETPSEPAENLTNVEGQRWIDLARAENAGNAPETVPEEAQEAAPEAEATRIDLTGDPVAAISYGRQNGYGSLTEETLGEMDDYVQKTPGRRALFGVLTDEHERELFDEAGREKGNRTAIGVQIDNYGTLGGTMSKYALRLGSEDFPQELVEDTIGTFVTIIDEADEWAKGQIEQDEDFELYSNRYDAYLEAHPEKRRALDDAFALEDEIKSARKEEARRQEEAEKQAAQDALEAARAAVRAGEATDGQWALVAARAPELTRAQMLEDGAYRALAQEIALTRTLSDAAGEEDWMNAAALDYMRAHDLGGDRNSVAAMQAKDVIAGYLAQALDEQMRVAASLGYESLEAYHAATGTGDMELLQLRAEAAMRADERSLTPEVMEAMGEANAPAYEGTQEGAAGMARAIGMGVSYGLTSNHAEKLEAITTLLMLSDIENDGARVAASYTKAYGAYTGRAAYERDMRALAKEGYFPSQELTDYVLGYLNEGGDPYALGILPEDLGWVAKPAAGQKQKAEAIAAMAQKLLTPAQGTAFEITGSTAANVENQLLARTLGVMGVNSWVTSLLAYGAGPYLEGAKGALGEGRTGRAANLLGATQAAAIATANAGTEEAFAARVGKLTGMSAAQKLGMEALGSVGGTKVYTGMARLWAAGKGALRGTAKSLADEVLHDELLERLYQAGFGGTARSLLEATDGGTRLPSPSQILRAGADGLRAIDVGEAVAGVVHDAPKNALYMLPMALVSGGIEGASEWKSTKAVHRLAQTGSEEDARAALTAISEDMSDGQKAKAFDAGMRAAGRAEAAAQILTTDREIEKTLDAASGAQAQADAHGEEADKSRARMRTAAETMQDAQARMDAGEIDPELPVMLTRAADEFAKARQGLDEHERERRDKARESERLFGEARSAAAAQAAREMNGAAQRLIGELSEMAPEIAARAREEEQEQLDKVLEEEALSVATGGDPSAAAGGDLIRFAPLSTFPRGEGFEGVEAARQIPPGYALSQFENKSLPESGVSTQETDAVLAGTMHKVDTDDALRRGAASRIARTGVRGVTEELMRATRLTNEDIAAGRECLRILRDNGDLIRHATLSAKLGAEGTRTAKELRAYAQFQRESAESAGADTLKMAEAYNRRKGRYKQAEQETPAQMSLGETPYQPFMEAQVSRSTSDPAMQQLASDIGKRSGLALYWADMPDGVRAFFDRDKGVIVMNQKVGAAQGAYVAAIHEYTHYMENQPGYDAYAETVLRAAYGSDEDAMRLDEGVIRDEYAQSGRTLTDDLLRRELVAAATEQVILGDEAFMRTLFAGGKGGAAVRMLAGMDAFLRKRGAKKAGQQEVERYNLIEAARARMREAVMRSGERRWKKGEGKEQEDGGWVYQLYAKKTKEKKDVSSPPPEISRARQEQTSPDTSIAQAETGVKTKDTPNGAQYALALGKSAHYDYSKPFAEQVEDWLAGRIPQRDTLLVSGTPDVLRQIGFSNLPITIDQTHLRKIFGDPRKNGKPKNADHDLGMEFMKRLPDVIQNPLAIIENSENRESGVIMIFAEKNKNADGRPVIGAISVSAVGKINDISIDAARLSTVHSRGNLASHIEQAVEREKSGETAVYYINPQKEARALLEYSQSQVLGSLGLDGFIHSILEDASPVKAKHMEQTETRQFERWFGKSKVVNGDGTPKKVFGGNDESAANRSANGARWFGDAQINESGGESAGPTYLKMENPYRATVKPDQLGDEAFRQAVLRKAQQGGYDGVILDGGAERAYAVFKDRQIKSADRNVGIFDPENPNPYYSLDADAETRQSPRADVNDVYGKVMANIEFLERSEDISYDNEWHMPLNPFQREMIDRFKLRGTPLPGLHYNRATARQRMLCAIFATPQDSRGIGNMTLGEQLEALARGNLAVVTEADYNYILSQAAIVEGSETDEEGLPLGREGQQAYGRMRDAQANIEPASLGDKLSAWRYMNLLSSPVTTIKNLSGNVLMQEADRISKNRLTEFVDKLVERKTGTRTIARATREERRAGTQAAIRRGRDAFDDYFVAGTSTSRSRNYDVGGDGRVFQSEALELGRNIINFCMDAGDQVFMEKAIVEEMAALERLKTRIRDEETGEMREMTKGERYREAYARASQRFYHDDNAFSRVMSGVYNVPIVGTVARVVIPFVKTPSNVALRMFDYSPLGLAKSIFLDGIYAMNANKGDDGIGVNFDQAKFVMGVGRGMTGTGVTVAGMLLYSAGLLSFGREDEENDRRRGVLASLGEPYSLYVNIGGTKHELAFTLPVTAGLSIGAGIAAKMQDGEEAMDIAMGILGEQFNQIFDNTYLSSLNDIFRGYDDGAGIAERLVATTAKSYAQQMFSPSILRAIAKAMDPYQRDTQSASTLRQFISETVVQNWPGLRQTLPVRTDLTGEAMTQHRAYGPGGAWENAALSFVDSLLTPTATYSDKDDAALCELLDLSYRTGETSFLPTYLASKNELKVTKTLAAKLGDELGAYTLMLTDEERREANRMYGDILFNGTRGVVYPGPGMERYDQVEGLRSLMESARWLQMDDGERIKAISDMAKTVKELVTVQTVRWAND